LLEQLKTIAEEAGRRILEHYTANIEVTYKDDDSPLTRADRASHTHIMRCLEETWPDIPVISEEGELPEYSERQPLTRFWLVDPLDGTKEFIKRNGDFTVNIALVENGKISAGVVGVPVHGRFYTAARGEGAWLAERGQGNVRLTSRTTFAPEKLSAAVSRSHPSGALDAFLKKLPSVNLEARGSSLKFCAVAEGSLDFYPRFGPLWEWDTAAAHIILEESGGVVRDLDGKPLTYNKPVLKHEAGFIAASRPALLDHLCQKL
jgi:3'(2'), 5'-bisphosphate nucleotidase